MSVHVVPIIYDKLTKKVLRWYLLDYKEQLKDPAFLPKNIHESVLNIPTQIYKLLRDFNALQSYVTANAP